MNEPARNEALEQEIAAYEQRLRAELLRDHELAALAAEQRAGLTGKRLLPMAGSHEESGPACSLEA